MTHQHVPKLCADCPSEADYFLCSETPRALGPQKYDDVYLCADCCASRYWFEGTWVHADPDDDESDLVPPTPDVFATPRDVEAGRDREPWDAVKLADGVCYEFGKYSCDPECDVCESD